ncbi:sodium/proline symporter [Pseudomonas saudimassiliensis]|uniref:Sodium/proline symporter n=2 Tax=Pseudomonas saudimassiliensis TaxID=1461581 RepID=A0A078MLE4_9PSED|nr:sodium/proline symporter [Pseudomonas saudimassiliensis]CEF27210.1 sodium/proline symporter [Pseudomonas saudimassiliensis]
MTGNMTILTATFVVYIAVMLAIGFIAYRRTSNLSDYILGGRSIGPGTAALSAGASDMSGWLLLGLPGYAMVAGYEASWIAIGLLAGTWLNWLLVARRLRIYSHAAGDSVTLPAYFENRFEDKTRLLRIISAIFILLFFLFYTSSGLVAAGKLFESSFGFSYEVAVVIGVLTIISYTFFGGFLAVAWTDVIQGLLMAAALVAVPVMALSSVGGLGETLAVVEAQNPALLDPFTDAEGSPLGFIAIISLLGWGLGYFGQPHILARFKAIKSEDDLPTARRIAVLWSGLCLVAALATGWVGISYFGNEGLADAETVFLALTQAVMHPVVAGLLLAAVLAAIMSTADSQLLVSSSALAEDFYKALFRRAASQNELVWVGRFAVVLIAAIALALAFNPDSTVLGLVSYAWAGFGAAFGPAILLSLFWRRMNGAGALAGIIVGGLTVVIWKQIDSSGLYEIIPGFILATVAIVVVSLVTPAPARSVGELFDQVGGRS